MILCGAKQIDITPPIGTPMAGYGARLKNSEGIHDSLTAQIIYLNNSFNEVLLVGLDLVAVDADFVKKVREQIHEKLGIPTTSILVACTHTHSGPDGYATAFPRESQNIDETLRQITIEKIAGAARWAKTSSSEATLNFASGLMDGIGLNRNDPQKKVDNTVSLLRIDVDKKPLVVLVNYACHPTVMSAENLQISADLPGAARKFFHMLYPETIFMFLNGAAGDVSTRFTRRFQGFEELDRFGMILFGTVISLMQKTHELKDDQICSRIFSIDLPIRNFPSEADAQKFLAACEDEFLQLKKNSAEKAELRKAETKIQGARVQAHFVTLLKDIKSVKSEIQIIQIGSLLLVTLPGEPFTDIARGIKAAFADVLILVIGYANDYMGYFPIGEVQQTYETLKSPWSSDIGPFLIDECTSAINQSCKLEINKKRNG